ncbi:MAG: 3'-5' exonuclease [Sphingobium sp.]
MTISTVAGRDTASGRGTTRVLHPLHLNEGPTGEGIGRGAYIGVAIDAETTGLDWRTGKVIEFALRRFRYNEDGIITDIDRAYEWREDPGEPLTAEVSALTGLTDFDLIGHEIDTDSAVRLLHSASFVAAHNSAFDRPWVEKRLEEARDLPWVCSMSQVDWRGRGFDGRVLGYLLLQNGFYHCGHRASADVDAMIQMLRHRDDDGRTALSEMIATGSKPGWIIRAKGAHFDTKDALRARGYRWDAADDRKVWWREVADDQLAPEQFWLAANVYAAKARPTAICSDLERVTPRTRFA